MHGVDVVKVVDPMIKTMPGPHKKSSRTAVDRSKPHSPSRLIGLLTYVGRVSRPVPVSIYLSSLLYLDIRGSKGAKPQIGKGRI